MRRLPFVVRIDTSRVPSRIIVYLRRSYGSLIEDWLPPLAPLAPTSAEGRLTTPGGGEEPATGPARIRDPDDDGPYVPIGETDEDGNWTWADGGKRALGEAGIVFSGIITAVAIYELVKGAISVDSGNFPNPPGGEDTIDLVESTGTPGTVTVSMTLGPSVSWWKAAEIYNGAGQLLGSAWCKRDEGVTTNSTSVQTENLGSGYLVLKKAKLLGVHTSMYVIYAIASKDGMSLNFTWTRDR